MLVWNKIKQTEDRSLQTAYQIKNQPFEVFLYEQLHLDYPVFA